MASYKKKNKAKTAKKYGDGQIHQWRRSYAIPPPNGKCLKDTAERTIPFSKENILLQLFSSKNVLVLAYSDSLRSITMFIKELTTEEILDLSIPKEKPLFYDFNNRNLKNITVSFLWKTGKVKLSS